MLGAQGALDQCRLQPRQRAGAAQNLQAHSVVRPGRIQLRAGCKRASVALNVVLRRRDTQGRCPRRLLHTRKDIGQRNERRNRRRRILRALSAKIDEDRHVSIGACQPRDLRGCIGAGDHDRYGRVDYRRRDIETTIRNIRIKAVAFEAPSPQIDLPMRADEATE